MASYVATSMSGLYQYINGLHGGPRATNGDTVYISGTTISAGATSNIPSLYPQYGVSIFNTPGTSPIIFANNKCGTVQVVGSGTSEWLNNPIVISGVTFLATSASGTMDIGDYGWYSFRGCYAKIYDVSLSGKSNLQSKNCLTAEVGSGVKTFVEIYNSNIAQAGADLISTKADTNDNVPDAQQSYIKLYDCYLNSAGQKHNGAVPASTDQLITAHEGVPIYIYGGRIENGIPFAGADGYHLCYFADIDGTYITPSASGQTNAKHLQDMFVFYGNYINHQGTIYGNTIDGTTSGRSFVRSIGHSGIRNYALVKDNYIIWNGRGVGNEPIFSNSVLSISGGNYAVISNMVLQSGGFSAGDNFLVRQYPGAVASITGIVHSNIVVATQSNATFWVKTAETYTSGGPIFTNFITNNAGFGTKALVAYDAASIPSGQGSTTFVSNNWMNAGVSTSQYLTDTATMPTNHATGFGYIFSSGNLMNQAIPSNFAAPLYNSTLDNFSMTAAVSGTRFNYYPTPNGNLDFGSGVTPQITKGLDGVGEANFGFNYRGAKSRQRYDQVEFPSFMM